MCESWCTENQQGGSWKMEKNNEVMQDLQFPVWPGPGATRPG